MTFQALVIERDSTVTADGSGTPVRCSVQTLARSRLAQSPVEVAIEHSSLNYKDALIITGQGGLVDTYPHVPGIDLAGTIVAIDAGDETSGWSVGDEVLVTGCALGERHWGGMATRARVDPAWLVPRPHGLDTWQAMALGTAGLTAQLCVEALADGGVLPGDGPVLVTGASGGVGSLAVRLLAHAGYAVEAVSGDAASTGRLTELGALRIHPREVVLAAADRPLATARWAGAIDVAGGPMLAGVLAQITYGGVVASCGLAASSTLATTVMPFILRGITLRGIDSVRYPVTERAERWRRLQASIDPAALAAMTTTVGLAEVPAMAASLLAGRHFGRTVVQP
jgi:acrylyl-CoA reductase (NADPH)